MSLATWHRIWLVWFLLSFGSFLALEIYALCTDARRTLSDTIWWFEKFHRGQPVTGWTFAHLMFVGVLILVFAWLVGHFGWGLWR